MSEESWICPICCQGLGEHMEEIGALTYDGQRVEQALYHGGCISMMLLHQQKKRARKKSLLQDVIEWGVSPVSRKAVNGFLRMPPPTEHRSWLHFFNWRGDGTFSVAELISIVTHLFPVDPTRVKLLLNRLPEKAVQGDITVSASDLEHELLPYLASLHMAKEQITYNLNPHTSGWNNVYMPKPGKQAFGSVLSKFSTAIRCKALTHLASLRAASSTCSRIARLLLMHEVCAFYMRNSLQILWDCACEGNYSTIDSIKLLVHIVTEGDSTAVIMSRRFLRHNVSEMREAAATILSRAAWQGDPCAVRALRASFKDDSPSVRRASVMSMGKIIKCPDINSLSKMLPLLLDGDSSVRDAVEKTMPSLAPKGDKRVVDVLLLLAQEREPALRRASLTAFGLLTDCGNQRAINSVMILLKDHVKHVRVKACKTLPKLAITGDKQAISAMLSCLHDAEAEVKVAALQALPSMARKGDARVVSDMINLLRELRGVCTATVDSRGQLPLLCTLECGVNVLGYFAHPGDRRAITFCQSLLSNSHPRIVSAAEKAIAKLSAPVSEAGEPEHVQRYNQRCWWGAKYFNFSKFLKPKPTF
mmetsp:Transcript_6870/g.12305  ORF Transcript_6870/g.12305 Transcript_6870/m.12305 type:complete len:589 (+) Transcript_6870:68-1834(+)